MNRRTFLEGVFGGVAASGVIIQASRADIEAFASPLANGTPIVVERAPDIPVANVGQHLYNQHGECVAIVTSIDIRRTMESYDDGMFQTALPGLMRMDIRAEGIGTFWDGLVLRGPKA